METPDQMLERLERMGEQRVRSLVAQGYFQPKTIPLVRGWLESRTRKDNGEEPARAALDDALTQMSSVARQSVERADRATETAARATRMALIALGVGGLGLLVSILGLFALALR